MFGGWVRDMISGDEPNDIDVLLPPGFTEDQARLIALRLGVNLGLSVLVEYRYPREVYGGGIRVLRCTYTRGEALNGERYQVDFVIAEDDSFYPDVNVNRLAIDIHKRTMFAFLMSDMLGESYIFPHPRPEEMVQIIQDIRERKYRGGLFVSKDRLLKLQNKGYTERQAQTLV